MNLTRISCEESDKLRPGLCVVSSCTDLDGQFHAEPQIDTVWGHEDGTEIMRDARFPRWEWDSRKGDRKACEHYLIESGGQKWMSA